MTGSPAVIANLLELLAAEYNSNLQCRMDKVSLKVLGVPKIAKKFNAFANQAHDFYQTVTKRLLELEATPSVDVGKVSMKSTVTELIQAALLAENALCALGIAGIEIAVKNRDETTAEKLRHIEERHEENVAWLEQQLGLITILTEATYIAEKL